MNGSIFLAIAALALSACGLLAPATDATQDMIYGQPERTTADPSAAAKAAAGRALIERGMTSENPAEAQHWINLGVGLLQ